MGLFSLFKKYGIDLFFYFAKGARVDAALHRGARSRVPLRNFPRHDAIPIERTGNHIIFDATDMMRQWQITTRTVLTLKNNSKNHAYNVTLLNSKELFDTCDPLPTLTSLAPNERLDLKVTFIQYMVAHGGNETEILPYIPAEKENQYLLIQYENERGTHFLTKFALCSTSAHNIYTYK